MVIGNFYVRYSIWKPRRNTIASCPLRGKPLRKRDLARQWQKRWSRSRLEAAFRRQQQKTRARGQHSKRYAQGHIQAAARKKKTTDCQDYYCCMIRAATQKKTASIQKKISALLGFSILHFFVNFKLYSFLDMDMEWPVRHKQRRSAKSMLQSGSIVVWSHPSAPTDPAQTLQSLLPTRKPWPHVVATVLWPRGQPPRPLAQSWSSPFNYNGNLQWHPAVHCTLF